MRITKTRALRWMMVALIATLFSAIMLPAKSQAAAGINSQVSFQGKIVNTNGTNLPDGTYNLRFKIYQDGTGCVSGGSSPCGGTLKWTETRLVTSSQGVTVTAGTFQVNLGSITAFGASVDWNQDTLWLSMDVGGTATTPVWDGEMTPFIRLTSVPYALNAGMVGGLTASQLVQLTPGSQQSGSINVSGNIQTGGTLQAATLDTPTSGALTVGSTNTTGVTLAKNTTITSGQTLTVGGQQVFSGAGILQAAAISSSVVYSNLTQIGTVTTGTWDASTIAPGYGGTGLTSYTIGDLLYASGTTALGKIAAVASGSCLTSNGTGASPVWGACTTGSSLQTAYTGGQSITQTAGGTITFTSGSNVPTADQFVVDNTGSTGPTTAGVNGINVKYKGGAAAVESAGMRIDFQPGSTSGGTWSGLRIVANTTGTAAGVTEYGVKVEGPGSPGSGTEEGVYIGSGWDVGLDIASGGIQLAAQSDPATPAAGELRLYAKTIAGRTMPKWVGPAGVDTPIQASFGFNRVAMVSPSGLAAAATGTVFNTWGANVTNSASAYTNPALASTSLATSVRRARLTSTAVAGNVIYSISSSTMAWRGNAAGLGGFYYTTRFSFATLQSGNRAFIGLTDSVAAPTNVDPTTSGTIGRLGIAINASTGNLNWVNNVAGTAPTVTGLGANFPVNNTDLYELIIYSPPNGSSITYRVKDLTTGNVTADTSVSTNIPASTTFLGSSLWMTNNATAATVTIDSGGLYLESDN